MIRIVSCKQISLFKIFDTPQLAAQTLAQEFKLTAENILNYQSRFNIALSGGNTPRLFYSILSHRLTDWPAWKRIHLYWGDERCVPPEDSQSNYLMVKESLIDKINIPGQNVHRIHGESEPVSEALRYHKLIMDNISTIKHDWPIFDWILLGIGEDGHTASLFPGSEALKENQTICTIAVNPGTQQKRISLTLPLINSARNVIFLVSGRSKAAVVQSVIKQKKESVLFPAAQVKPLSGILTWYLDREAANLL